MKCGGAQEATVIARRRFVSRAISLSTFASTISQAVRAEAHR